MRHQKSTNQLGRYFSFRKATIRDISKATLRHQRVRTTKTRAKVARKMVDRLITLGKHGTLASRRKAFSILCDHKLVSELFNKIAKRFNKRNVGYTRIIPLSFRKGDHAALVYLELTEKEIVAVDQTKKSRKKKTKKQEVSAEKPIEKPIPKKKVEEKQKGEGEKKKRVEKIVQEKKEIPKATQAVSAEDSKKEKLKEKGTTPSPTKEEKSKDVKKEPPPKIIGGIKKLFQRGKKDKPQ